MNQNIDRIYDEGVILSEVHALGRVITHDK